MKRLSEDAGAAIITITHDLGVVAGLADRVLVYGPDRRLIATHARAYGRGLDIDTLYRVAPRVLFNAGKVRLAAEIEYTNAAYGTADAMGTFGSTKWIPNLRLLGAVYYFF